MPDYSTVNLQSRACWHQLSLKASESETISVHDWDTNTCPKPQSCSWTAQLFTLLLSPLVCFPSSVFVCRGLKGQGSLEDLIHSLLIQMFCKNSLLRDTIINLKQEEVRSKIHLRQNETDYKHIPSLNLHATNCTNQNIHINKKEIQIRKCLIRETCFCPSSLLQTDQDVSDTFYFLFSTVSTSLILGQQMEFKPRPFRPTSYTRFNRAGISLHEFSTNNFQFQVQL